MYLKSINIDNVGAIKKLNIDLPLAENGNPNPVILVGKNGAGKTLVMSSLLDSLIQIKRSNFQLINEVNERNFYKAGKKDYISDGEKYSFVNIKYLKSDSSVINYRDIASNDPAHTRNLLQHYGINFQDDFSDNGFHRDVTGDHRNIFGKSLILYFPVNRYYSPAWLVEKEDIRIQSTENYVGKDNSNIIKMDVISDVESWILDVILDRNLYEQKTQVMRVFVKNGNDYLPFDLPMAVPPQGKNSGIVNAINEILFTMLKVKFPDIEAARFGVSSKENGRRVSVIVKVGGIEKVIAPTFSHLSSGETMIVSLFSSIIKDFDKLGHREDFDANEIQGIVIIDEVDLNLHIEYTKDVLPKMIKLFPKVQFIMTSHSPFFLIGMKEVFGNEYTIYNMPNGDIIHENDFEEMKKAYSIFIKEFDDFSETLSKIKRELAEDDKPIVVTEGKTDWRHIKNALSIFQERGEYTDLDLQFHEYDDDSFSDSKLNSFLDNIKLVENKRKIIGVFDRDEGNGKQHAKNEINYLNNNVFAISIPQPDFRSYHEGVCIELMYRDDDLLRKDNDGRRIYLSSEFNKIGRLIEDVTIGVSNAPKIKGYLSKDKEKIVDSDVYDFHSNSLALSKINFANAISSKTPPFEDIDISAFKPLFDTFRKIINS